jgi:hypothetical protein
MSRTVIAAWLGVATHRHVEIACDALAGSTGERTIFLASLRRIAGARLIARR